MSSSKLPRYIVVIRFDPYECTFFTFVTLDEAKHCYNENVNRYAEVFLAKIQHIVG